MSITLIDIIVDLTISIIFLNIKNSVNCKSVLIHSFSWFEILSKTLFFRCGYEENA